MLCDIMTFNTAILDLWIPDFYMIKYLVCIFGYYICDIIEMDVSTTFNVQNGDTLRNWGYNEEIIFQN